MLTHVDRVLRAVVDFVQTLMNPFYSLVKVGLVEAVETSQVDLEPPQSSLAERLRLREHEEATTEVITDMAEMGRQRVCTSTEVDVVWEIDVIAQELARRCERLSEVHHTNTYRPCNFNLIVYAAPL